MRLLIITIVLFSQTLLAADWPQWRGQHRDGASDEKGLLPQWPKDGPPVTWSIDTLGAGFSGPSVVGDRIYIMGSDTEWEYLYALAVATGKEQWRIRLGSRFKNGWGDGPRSTPTASGDIVAALGAQGVLVVANRDGKELWRTDLRKDHDGRLMHGNILDIDWGYSESPLIDGDRLIVSPGGPKGTVAAFDVKSGKVCWRTASIADTASYSSIIRAEIGNVTQYVQLTGGIEDATGVLMKSRPSAIGISPANGEVLWKHPIRYTTAGVINTPVVQKNGIVYASCGYGGGCTILKVKTLDQKWTVEDLTTNETKRVLGAYHGGIIASKDRIFGYSDRSGWVCQSLPSGEELWCIKRGGIGSGSHIRVGSHLVIVLLDGRVVMTEPNDGGWTVRGDFTPSTVSPIRKANGNIRVCTHPVLANGRLYIRDQERLVCYDLRAK